MTPIIGLAVPYWLGSWFGFYPTWQTCICQFAAAAFVLLSYYAAQARAHRRKPRPAPPTEIVGPLPPFAGAAGSSRPPAAGPFT